MAGGVDRLAHRRDRVGDPVEVSLWTARTALISWFLSSRKRVSSLAGSMARRQSFSSVSTRSPNPSARSPQFIEK